jgi:hypothetical protein
MLGACSIVALLGGAQAQQADAASLAARVAVDAHVCKLFDDIAIKFRYDNGKVGAEFGRVVRMRKKAGKKWIDYVKPVDSIIVMRCRTFLSSVTTIVKCRAATG